MGNSVGDVPRSLGGDLTEIHSVSHGIEHIHRHFYVFYVFEVDLMSYLFLRLTDWSVEKQDRSGSVGSFGAPEFSDASKLGNFALDFWLESQLQETLVADYL
jgi:hypothetical protein